MSQIVEEMIITLLKITVNVFFSAMLWCEKIIFVELFYCIYRGGLFSLHRVIVITMECANNQGSTIHRIENALYLSNRQDFCYLGR